jgi:hypothetical protein
MKHFIYENKLHFQQLEHIYHNRIMKHEFILNHV